MTEKKCSHYASIVIEEELVVCRECGEKSTVELCDNCGENFGTSCCNAPARF